MTAGSAPENSRVNTGPAPSTGIQEVVVTARRRQENLIDVPVTVTALTAQKLDSIGLLNFDQLQDYVPGLAFNSDYNGRLGGQIIIRGMTPSVSSNASVFIDGVPVSSGVVQDVTDVARVEVLKGPQTAYFGRSTFAGAINFVTKTPDMDNYHAHVEAEYGSGDLTDVRGTIEGPIIKDVLSMRITGSYYSENGTYTNSATGGTLDNEQTRMLTGALRFTPTNRLTFNFFGFIQNDNDGDSAFEVITKPNLNCNAGANPGGAPNYYCGAVPNRGLTPIGLNDTGPNIASFLPAVDQTNYGTATNPIPRLLSDSPNTHAGEIGDAYHAHGGAEYDAGFVTLNALVGYNLTTHRLLEDLDQENSSGIPSPYAPGTYPGAPTFDNWLVYREDYYQDYSFELRATTDQSKPIRGFVGVNYAVTHDANFVLLQESSGPLGVGGLGAINRSRTPAVFGSVAWDILHNLTFSFEGRYQIDKIDALQRNDFTSTSGTVLVNGVQQGTVIAGEAFRSFTPRVLLQYHPIRDTMIYASYSQGVNPGTFNTSVLAFTPAFQQRLFATTGAGLTVKPENLTNYEVGVKGQFWDHRAQLTLAAYHAIWTNQIVAVNYQDPGPPVGTGQGTSVDVNIGKTLLNGVELEGIVKPVPQLEVSGNFSYNGSDIRQYVCVACQPYAGANVSVIGNTLPRSPTTSASASVQWTQPIQGNMNGFIRGDYYYKGKIYADETNLAYTQPQSVANFHLGVSTPVYRVEFFVTNAFDDEAPTSIVRSQDLVQGFGYDFQLGTPDLRRFGVRLTYDY